MSTIDTSNVTTIMLIVMLFSAVIGDIRTHRISNVLVLMVLFLGLASQLGSLGSPGIVYWLGGAATSLGIFVIFYIGGGMGAGDVKLMAAIGGFMGPMNAVIACGFALLAGLPLVVMALIARSIQQPSESQTSFSATGTFTNTGTFQVLSKPKRKRSNALSIFREGKAERIPYAAAIAAGAIGGLWWSGRLDQLAGVLLA